MHLTPPVARDQLVAEIKGTEGSSTGWVKAEQHTYLVLDEELDTLNGRGSRFAVFLRVSN